MPSGYHAQPVPCLSAGNSRRCRTPAPSPQFYPIIETVIVLLRPIKALERYSSRVESDRELSRVESVRQPGDKEAGAGSRGGRASRSPFLFCTPVLLLVHSHVDRAPGCARLSLAVAENRRRYTWSAIASPVM